MLLRRNLKRNGLKVTPQRIAILEAIFYLNNHPSAENIIEYIRVTHPNVATGTVYKVLGLLVEKDVIKKVKTENDILRYDGIIEKHHHLYCIESDLIVDYFDEDLDTLMKDYFKNKKFKNFTIEDIVVQIKGKLNKG